MSGNCSAVERDSRTLYKGNAAAARSRRGSIRVVIRNGAAGDGEGRRCVAHADASARSRGLVAVNLAAGHIEFRIFAQVNATAAITAGASGCVVVIDFSGAAYLKRVDPRGGGRLKIDACPLGSPVPVNLRAVSQRDFQRAGVLGGCRCVVCLDAGTVVIRNLAAGDFDGAAGCVNPAGGGRIRKAVPADLRVTAHLKSPAADGNAASALIGGNLAAAHVEGPAGNDHTTVRQRISGIVCNLGRTAHIER